MMLRIGELAASDLEDIYDYSARDNLEAALRTLQELYEMMERLISFPQLGHSRRFGTRELAKSPFIIVYRVVGAVISIEAVFQGARRH